MPVKLKQVELSEHAWIREFMPEDHAALFMQGGPLDELMWLHQVHMNPRSYHFIEGIIKPDLSLGTGPEIRRYFLDRYDQIVIILEAARVPFAKLPGLTLTANFYRPPASEPRFVDWEARVRIELLSWTTKSPHPLKQGGGSRRVSGGIRPEAGLKRRRHSGRSAGS